MRKFSNVLVGVMAGAVCVFVTLLALDSDIFTIVYNLAFLAVMLLIILLAWVLGFRRIFQTIAGLDRASEKLKGANRRGALAELTSSNAKIFEVEYLDKKYQEYLAYLRKTNSPCDIGDYVGEYEINNYTHRRVIEMIPDVLTSLGILGTFVGLVWGLRGFNPQTYEAMTSSVSSLVNGIKVAFITSIYGISLSMAFSYWLRGAFSRVSESLDSFLDTYYLCAVPPTDVTAMNFVLSNQKEQTKVMEGMADALAKQIAESFDGQITPLMEEIKQTLDNFTQVITLQQEKLLENISHQVMDSMKKELLSEFSEMRLLLRESNRAQKDFIQFMSDAQARFQTDFLSGEREMTRVMKASTNSQAETLAAMQEQQENLREFVEYMAQAMEKMSRISDLGDRTLEAVTQRLEEVAPKESSEDLEDLIDRIDSLVGVMERQQRQAAKKKGMFR